MHESAKFCMRGDEPPFSRFKVRFSVHTTYTLSLCIRLVLIYCTSEHVVGQRPLLKVVDGGWRQDLWSRRSCRWLRGLLLLLLLQLLLLLRLLLLL